MTWQELVGVAILGGLAVILAVCAVIVLADLWMRR